jgi:peroxiredoxin
MRTALGPAVVIFYSGGWSDEDVAYFKDLATREEEINHAGATIVGIGVGEPGAARDFVRETGIKSYVLYDYASAATRDYGLLEKDREHGEYARPATFIVNSDHKMVQAWLAQRPEPGEILAKVSEITGLPKPVEEDEAAEKKPKRPRKARGEADDEAGEKRRAVREDSQNAEASPRNETGDGAEAGSEADGRNAGNEPASQTSTEE